MNHSTTEPAAIAGEHDGFWKSRPVLTHIHDFARARCVGPWAVLGTVLARVVAATPAMVQLPPTIGSHASLNLFVGLVGESGDGKDSARRVARDAVALGPDEGFREFPLGSGEGLSHMFMRQEKGVADPVMWNSSTLVIIGEIDTLAALMQRQSSTVASQLRQAAMGEQLGMFYVDQAKRMMVPEHQYRLSLVAGIQPARSDVLLADSAGGTPQRFVWLPAGDPGAPDDEPDEPPPVRWTRPAWIHARQDTSAGHACRVVDLPDLVTSTIKATRKAKLRGQGDALDGHALLTRTKVAAALAILDGRTSVDPEDWELAGAVMAVSDGQRARCQRALAAESRRANHGKAVAEAERAVVVAEHTDQAAVGRCAQAVKRKLAQSTGRVAHNELRRAVAYAHRKHFETAVDALTAAGEVTVEHTEYRSQTGRTYALASQAAPGV